MPELSKTILKAWTILDELARAGTSATLTELAQRTGDSKTATWRVLNTLLHCGLVEVDETGRYEIGPAVVNLANARARKKPLYAEVLPVLRTLVQTTGCTGYLGYLQGTEGVVLHMELGTEPVVVVAQPGQVYGAHTVAFGKAILAELTEPELLERYRSYCFPSNSAGATDLHSLLEEIEDVRRRGFATAETYEGMKAYGIALLTSAGWVGISLSMAVLGKTPEQVAQRENAIVEHLKSARALWRIKGGVTQASYGPFATRS